MSKFSLLYPENAVYSSKTLPQEAMNDLSFDFILNALTNDSYEKTCILKVMSEITDSKEVVEYRSDIFDDFYRLPELREGLTKLFQKLSELRDLTRFQKDEEASFLWQLVNRLREVDEYIKCITEMKKTLSGIMVKSAGMLRLKSILSEIEEESGFDELKADIKEIYAKIGKVKSVTVGVNLDDMLRPREAGIVSLNDKEFTKSGIMKRFLSLADSKDDLRHGVEGVEKITKFHPSNALDSDALGKLQQTAKMGVSIENIGVTGSDPLSDSLKKSVTDILRRTVFEIRETLKKHVGVSGYALVSLMPEIVFYIRWAELFHKIADKNIPICKPEIAEDNGGSSFEGIYNLKLAIKKANGEDIEIVDNDIEFNKDMAVYIMTGPNRGGKTTFTQAVGLSFLLAQNGLYVTAKKATVSPCDNIYTHFPADENNTVDLGRLGEEAKRLAEIFDQATDKSILLLNESFATTNVSEGLSIAKDVIKAMCYLGVRSVFNTHMHDLARNLNLINEDEETKSKAASLVTGISDGKRSYKVSLAPPQGISYAKDIAKQYGVSFEQIKNAIDSKK